MQYENLKNLKHETVDDTFNKIHIIISKDLKLLYAKAGVVEFNYKDISKVKQYVDALKIIADRKDNLTQDKNKPIVLNFKEVSNV